MNPAARTFKDVVQSAVRWDNTRWYSNLDESAYINCSGYLSVEHHHIYYLMSEGEGKQKRPEFVNGVRVKAPEEYDFNTWGTSYSTQERTSPSMARISDYAQTLCGKRRNLRTGSAVPKR